MTDDLIQDELEALRRDVERYRHMRKSAAFQDRNGPGLYWHLPRLDHDLPIGERLDRAIDRDILELKARASGCAIDEVG